MQHRKLRKNCRNPKTFRTVFIAREIPSSGGMGTKGFSDNLESFHKNTKNAITQMQIQTHKCKYKYTNTNTQNHKYTDSQQQRPGFSNNLECLLLKVQPSAKCVYCHTQIGLPLLPSQFQSLPTLNPCVCHIHFKDSHAIIFRFLAAETIQIFVQSIFTLLSYLWSIFLGLRVISYLAHTQ